MGGGSFDLRLMGTEPIFTEYWSYPLSLVSEHSRSGTKKALDAADEWSVTNSLVTWISVVLELVKGFWICTGVGRDGLLKARSCLRLAKTSRPARTYIQNEIKMQHLVCC